MILTSQIIKPYISGLHLGSYTYLFSNILDHTISRTQTLELIEKNPKLYIQSTVSNFINLIGLSPIYYIIADNVLLNDKSVHIQLMKTLAIVLTHNIIFYKLHKIFHENKNLFFIHKFHHKFIKPIPSNGNAVSIHEYNIACCSFFDSSNDIQTKWRFISTSHCCYFFFEFSGTLWTIEKHPTVSVICGTQPSFNPS